MAEKAINKVMTRSDIMNRLSRRLSVDIKVAEQIVKNILEKLTEAISSHERIEIRGFGSFEVRHRSPRQARNPKTGESIQTSDRYTVHFKPGKELRQRVNNK
jgi:integration host factor subunit beta